MKKCLKNKNTIVAISLQRSVCVRIFKNKKLQDQQKIKNFIFDDILKTKNSWNQSFSRVAKKS
jgi:hypothetical protein